MSKSCVFRADANSTIGTGHYMRSLSLAISWRDSGQRACMAGDAPESLVDRARSAGIEHFSIAPTSNDVDRDEVLAVGDKVAADVVCVDGYQFDPDYIGLVRESGRPIVEFSDGLIWSDYQSDLLLDQNLGAESRQYVCAPWTKQLLGVRYACLAPQFSRQADSIVTTPETVENILVSLGGADPKGVTSFVLSTLFELVNRPRIVVLVGASNPRVQSIVDLVGERENVEIVRDSQNVSALMEDSDLAIAAAGSTSWELAAMGVPALLVTIADNQIEIASKLDEAGVAINLGPFEGLSGERLFTILTEVIQDSGRRGGMSRKGRELVDGGGASRVVDEMLRSIR